MVHLMNTWPKTIALHSAQPMQAKQLDTHCQVFSVLSWVRGRCEELHTET